jgi:hypothetical protein
MKTSLSLGLIVAAASTLAACSSDEGEPRGNGGTGISAGAGGTSAAGSSAGGMAGTSAGGAGGAGGGSSVSFNYGPELEITAPAADIGNVVDSDGATAINGGTFLTQSDNMTVPAAEAHRDGGLCFSGTTAIVPDPNSYGTYWGAELGLNLKLIPDPAAPPPAADADAGAGDAGAATPLIPDPAGWPYGNVIGFSYKLVGNNPAAADQGVPPSRIRFKALPRDSDGMQDNYCKDLVGTVNDGVVNVLFSEITFECWAAGNPSIGPDATTINVVDVGPPRVVTTPTNPRALQNISWQIASDVVATTPAPIAFDFCITELKPILATP